MTKEKQQELGDILKEGSAALREMRRGLENACVELRIYYRNQLDRNLERSAFKQQHKETRSVKGGEQV